MRLGMTAFPVLLPFLLLPHERDTDAQPPEFVRPLDAYLFIDVSAIGVNRAHLFPSRSAIS